MPTKTLPRRFAVDDSCL